MSYLLDTCVVSEFARPAPSPKVVTWLNDQVEEELFVSAVIMGELARGIARLEDGPQKRRLAAWLHSDLHARFRGRILPVSAEVALKWGELWGEAMHRGISISMADGLIGATGIVHSMTVVTRDVRDLKAMGAIVFSPWED